MRTHTNTAEETEDFGGQLARARPSDEGTFAVLYLAGELGAGKTTFARGFLRALGVTDPVRSPSYTLLEWYVAGALTVLHIDLYRLNAPAELESLGLRDWAGAGYLWLVEWPEKGALRLPPADLILRFSVDGSGHDIDVSALSALGARWLVQLTGEPRHA